MGVYGGWIPPMTFFIHKILVRGTILRLISKIINIFPPPPNPIIKISVYATDRVSFKQEMHIMYNIFVYTCRLPHNDIHFCCYRLAEKKCHHQRNIVLKPAEKMFY